MRSKKIKIIVAVFVSILTLLAGSIFLLTRLRVKEISKVDVNSSSAKKEIKVSVIVPVYKTEKYLDECVRSILDQTLEGFEAIFVDDGSPDNCGEILNR